MEYKMEKISDFATLDNRYNNRRVRVRNRRRISGGIVVDVEVLDLENWEARITRWTEPECNITYTD